MAEEFGGQECMADLPLLPSEPVPAMAYIPFQQWSGSLHSAERALEAGTLFPVLDKPFCRGKGWNR